MLFGQPFGNLAGSIRRGIVHYYQMHARGQAYHLLNHSGQIFSFVVGGGDYVDWCLRRHASAISNAIVIRSRGHLFVVGVVVTFAQISTQVGRSSVSGGEAVQLAG